MTERMPDYESRIAYGEALPPALTGTSHKARFAKLHHVLRVFSAPTSSEGGSAVFEYQNRMVFSGGYEIVERLNTELNDTTREYDPWAEVAEFLSSIHALCQSGKRREATAKALDYLDVMQIAGRFVECNYALSRLRPELLAPPTIIAILSATHHAKRNLFARETFYQAAFNGILRNRGRKYAKELLTQYH